MAVRRLASIAGLAVAALLLAGCSGNDGAPAAAGPTTTRSSTSPSSSSSPEPSDGAGATATPTPPGPPGPPHRLRVTTVPAGALVTVAGADQRTLRGRSPVAGMVSGPADVTVRMAGYDVVHRRIDLIAARRLTVWLDPAGLLLASEFRSRTGPNPKQVAYSPDGRQVWVTLLGSRSHGVQVFDARTGQLVHVIATGAHGAVEVLFAPGGRTAYVSQMWTGTVLVIDTATYRIRRVLSTHGTWSKEMALAPGGRKLYVSNWVSNDVSEIDLRTGHVRLIKTVPTPRGIAVTPDGKHLYVAGFQDGEIEDIALASGKGKVLMRTGGAMRHMVLDSRSGTLYVDDMAASKVFAVDIATDHVRLLARTDHMPNTIDLSPDGKVLYVSCRGANNPVTYALPGPEWGSVVVIDTATGRELDAIVGGNQPTGLDVSADGRHLAFTDFLDDDVRTYAIPPYATYASGHGGRAESHLADLPKR
ncbi:MAG: YncE family protein [Frankiaceae bacterium]